MDNCIFCKKKTNNEYSYYVADKPNGVRKKVVVFACTKCLKKKSVITLSIISALFLLSLIGQISNLVTGNQPVETGGLITLITLVLFLLFWTFYKVYEIKTDKLLPETKAAKNLIGKAKKVNPAKTYFTPEENALLPMEFAVKTETQSVIDEKDTSTLADKIPTEYLDIKKEQPKSRNSFLLSLIFFFAAVPLLLVGIIGITNHTNAWNATIFELTETPYLKKGTYDIRAIYKSGNKSPALIFTFTNKKNRTQYIGSSVADLPFDKYHLLAKVNIEEAGNYAITVSGVTPDVTSGAFSGKMILENQPVDRGFLNLMNYEKLVGFKSSWVTLTLTQGISLTVLGGLFVIIALLIILNYSRKRAK